MVAHFTGRCAELQALTQPQARHLLRELTRGCLITEHAPAQYVFHDLDDLQHSNADELRAKLAGADERM